MNINTTFEQHIIPREYSFSASGTGIIRNNPVKSFPFIVTDIPMGTKTLAWTLIDYDAIPVCGYAWIHWVVANYDCASSTADIQADFSRINNAGIQGKNSFASGLLAEDFSDIAEYYVGPTPPDKDHNYELTVYALEDTLDLQTGYYLNDFYKKIEGRVIKQTTISLVGKCI